MTIQNFENLENIDSEVFVTPAHVLRFKNWVFLILEFKKLLNLEKSTKIYLHKLKLLGNFHSIFLIDRNQISLNPCKNNFSKYFSF